MSIKLMSAIFETEFYDLHYVKDGHPRVAKASTAKLVLLAIADHANDMGESAYPGYERLTVKTALSKQGISDTLEALKYNGLLSVGDKRSRVGTNNYTINLRALPSIAKELPDIVKPLDSEKSSHLTLDSQATGLEPSVNHQLNKELTSAKIADVPPPLDWQIATGQPIRMPTKEQEFESAVDIAAMKICQAGADLEPLAKAFMRARGMTPATRREYKAWGAALRELKTANVTPEAVTSAVTRLKKDNLTIADPWAIIKTARDISTRATTEQTKHKPVIRSLE